MGKKRLTPLLESLPKLSLTIVSLGDAPGGDHEFDLGQILFTVSLSLYPG